LQHGVSEWLPRFHPTESNLIMLRGNLEALAKEFEGQDLGFALEG
jgi:hypothetical protein